MEGLNEKLVALGYPTGLPFDGVYHRFDREGRNSGWFKGEVSTTESGRTVTTASFGDFKTDESHRWRDTDNLNLSASESAVLAQEYAALQEQRALSRARAQEAAAVRSQMIWDAAIADGESWYLRSKGLSDSLFGCRSFTELDTSTSTLVPARDIDGRLWGFQRVDRTGLKAFEPGTKVRGCFHAIGDLASARQVFVCEGVATAASVAVAMDAVAVAAFSANNLIEVARVIRARYSNLRIVICGDDDKWTKRHDGTPWNTGRIKAEAAAKEVNGISVFPEFKNLESKYTDFNDLHKAEGVEEVRAQVSRALSRLEGRSRGRLELVKLSDLFAEPEERVPWLVEGLLPLGGTSIFAGKPKAGKTTLVRQLAMAVAGGGTFLGRATAHGPVIYLAVEEKRSEVRRHFRDMGATGAEEIYIHAALAPEDALEQLEAIAARHRPRLIVLDTMFRVVRVKDGNDYVAVTNALEPIQQLARGSGAHVLSVHHMGKVARDGGDGILGSTAIQGAFDTAVMIDRRDQVRTLKSIQRYGIDLEETELSFDPATRSSCLGRPKQESDLERVGDLILDFLRDAGTLLPEDDINKGISGRKGKKMAALRALFQEGKVLRSGKGCSGDRYLYGINPQF
jgi:phage/plasmid primase-like uncharacterized protein